VNRLKQLKRNEKRRRPQLLQLMGFLWD